MCSFGSNQNNINNFNEGTTEKKQLEKPTILNPDDVIYIPYYQELRVNKSLIPNYTLKCLELQSNIKSGIMGIPGMRDFKENVEAEVLKPNQSWQYGFLELLLVCNLIHIPNGSKFTEDMVPKEGYRPENTLTPDSVITVKKDVSARDILPSKTVTVGQLQNNISYKAWNHDTTPIHNLKGGFQASVLSQNQSWREGHIEIQIGCELVFKADAD